jgi:hypothetical protein
MARWAMLVRKDIIGKDFPAAVSVFLYHFSKKNILLSFSLLLKINTEKVQ